MKSDIWKEAEQAIQNTDWSSYWKHVDAGVAREVNAYAAARLKSKKEFQQRVFR